MKTRTGFVSNSSSSSFIIGIGKVEDKNELMKFAKSSKIEDSLVFMKTSEIIEGKNWEIRYVKGSSKAVVSSFTDDEVSCLVDPNKEEEFVYFYRTPGDDSDFWNEEYEEYSYDISDDFFVSYGLDDLFKLGNNGVSNFEVSYGAGRNG